MIAAYSGARQYEHALEQCHKTLELDPTFVAARAHLAALLARLGRYDEATAEVQKFYAFTGADVRGKSALGRVYAIAGRIKDARKIAEELEGQTQLAKLASALLYIYAVLGDSDRAFYWLEEAYRARVSELVFIRHVPDCDGLRGDPRFEDLLRRIGLPGGSSGSQSDTTVEQIVKVLEETRSRLQCRVKTSTQKSVGFCCRRDRAACPVICEMASNHFWCWTVGQVNVSRKGLRV